MRLRNVSIKVLACGALVALGMSVGSGAAHAALVEPTASQCAISAQNAILEEETLAVELAEDGLDVSGCPAPPAPGVCVLGQATDIDGDKDCSGTPQENEGAGTETPPPAPVCVVGHVTDIDGDMDCSGTPQENEGAGTETPPPAPVCVLGQATDSDGDKDCSGTPQENEGTATPPPSSVVTGCSTEGDDCVVPTTTTTVFKIADASADPIASPVVKGVTVLNVVAPLGQAGLTAAAAPKAVPTSGLPVTGGDVMGIAMLAFAGLGIGGALLLIDKRRRAA